MRRYLLLVILILAFRPGAAQSPPPSNWYKGNLHTHTINSDGDSPPYDVMAWYKRNGYQFLAITDHNTFTDPALFDTNEADNFLLIGAEEITNDKTVHVNAIGITKVIPPQPGSTVTEILQASIDAIRAQKGVPLINHPNFRWAFTASEMLPLKGPLLVEIASGLSASNHAGDGRIPATEQMWDQLLSAGMRIFAVAVDDAHNFRQEFTIERPSPGRGWVVVRAPTLTRDNIVNALTDGQFYASSGVNIKDIRATSTSFTDRRWLARRLGAQPRAAWDFVFDLRPVTRLGGCRARSGSRSNSGGSTSGTLANTASNAFRLPRFARSRR